MTLENCEKWLEHCKDKLAQLQAAEPGDLPNYDSEKRKNAISQLKHNVEMMEAHIETKTNHIKNKLHLPKYAKYKARFEVKESGKKSKR